MKIAELEPNTKVVSLVATIASMEASRQTPTGLKSQEGILEDESGQVKLTLWEDQVDKFKEGDKIIISTGWCKNFGDALQVSTGKFGKINKVPEIKQA